MDAFSLLKKIDSQCFNNAKTLVDENIETKDWYGIGFNLGDEFFVVRLVEVFAITNRPNITIGPSIKEWFLGVTSWGGKLLPVIDLEGYLSGSLVQDMSVGKILVIKQGNYLSGLLIKRLAGLKKFYSKDLISVEESNSQVDEKFLDGSFIEDMWPWNILNLKEFMQYNQFYSIVN